MRLKKLTLRNFKGIKDFTLDADGKNIAIFGDNGTGKTTICDALYWLLFDKDSNFKKQFEIKTLDKKGESLHGIEHEVEGTFIIDNSEITLKKIYKEIWTKKRGKAQKTFTGHTNDYEIDGVPVKKKEYTYRSATILDEEIFKLLTTPSYFPETLPWKDRRDLLLEICGDISDYDVIESDKKLKDLKSILADRSIEDHKKIIASKKAKINEELKLIPARIDEQTRNIADVKNIEIKVEHSEIKVIKKQISEKETQILRIRSGGEVADKTKKLREIEGQLLDLENEFSKGHNGKVNIQREVVRNAQDAHLEGSDIVKKAAKEIVHITGLIGVSEGQIKRLRIDWHSLNNKTYDPPENPEKCFACGTDIKESVRTEISEKALSEFNLVKSNKLESINKEGADLKKSLESKETELCQKEKDFESLKDVEHLCFLKLEVENKRLKVLESFDLKPKTDEYTVIESDGIKLVYEIELLKSGSSDEISEIKSSIETLETALRLSENKVADVENSEKATTRIKELEKQERELVGKFEEIERELFLMESFTRAKVEMMEGNINSKFKLAKFKLFNEQINGGLDECCEVTFNGVPYGSGLNNGSRVNVGLDIIKTLSEHYQTSAPIFIDNAESVTDIQAPENSQLIKMIVSEVDKQLRIEI